MYFGCCSVYNILAACLAEWWQGWSAGPGGRVGELPEDDHQ